MRFLAVATLCVLVTSCFGTSCATVVSKAGNTTILASADVGASSATRGVEAAWLGAAGLYLTDGETTVLIDPFVSRHRLVRVSAGLELPPMLDVVKAWTLRMKVPQGSPVVVTHSHYDHALDAPFFAQELQSDLYGSGDTAFVGIGAGMPAERIKTIATGQPVQLGDFKLTFIESCHGPAFSGIEPYPGSIEAPFPQPAPADSYKTGHVFSVLIEHPKARILHHSSPCTLPRMFEGVAADTVFLGVYGREDTPSLLAAVVDAVGATRVVPIHYDNFFRDIDSSMWIMPGADLEEFNVTLAERADLEVRALAFGERWRIP